MLTGTGIQIGNATQFGVSERFPRGLASNQTTVWLFGGNKGYTLDPATGIATRVGNVTGFGNSETLIRSGTYHNNQVLVYGHSRRKIQIFNTSAGTLSDWHSARLSYAGSESGTPQPWGIASLNGVLYGLDTNIDALYSISNTGVLTRIGASSLFGIGAQTTRGFTAYNGMLIAKDFSTGKIFSINPTTGVGTIIGETNTLPDTGFEALVEYDSQLYGAGSGADAWFRLYDVLWNETIADLEVDEGANETWDLSQISQDAASYTLQGTPPSWLSVAGSNLVATTAPDVSTDQNNDVTVRATRDGVNVDKTLRVVVRNIAEALTFGSETIANQALVVGTAISLTLPVATGGTGTITYSLTGTLPAGVTFAAGTRVLSGNPTGRFSSASFTYTATDGDSNTVELTFTIVVTAPTISFASNISNQSWMVGTAVNLTLPTASGGVGAFTYALTPALPTSITFVAATRVLSGTPSAAATVATYTYTATDSEGITHTQTFKIVVAAASAITFSGTIANQAWMVGTAVSLVLPTASGGVGTITYSLTPTLPSGVSFTASTRALAGTPTGRFTSATFTYTATDTAGTTNTLTFTIVVTATAITFNPRSFANQILTVGTAIALTLPEGAGGVGDLTASLTGTLPAGITFTASTRALAGNPTAVFSSATFTYTMTDDEDESESITFTIVVNAAALSFDSETIANQVWVMNTAITSFTLPEASGGNGTKTYSLTPTLPSGVTFTASTRRLSGTPTATFASATFTYTVTDTDSNTLDLTFTIIVTAAVTAEDGYFLDLGILTTANYDNAKLPIVIENEDGDDVIALRIPRDMAQILLVTATRIVTVLEGLTNDEKSEIKTALATITAAQTTKLESVNYHEWDATITGLSTGETVDEFVGNAFTIGDGVHFTAEFRVRRTDSALWTKMTPRLTLPVAAPSPTRVVGGGSGYGGSEMKFFQSFAEISVSEGSLTGLGSPQGSIGSATVHEGTVHFGYSSGSIFTLNVPTRASTLYVDTGNHNWQAFVSHDGTLYGWSNVSSHQRLYSITSAGATAIGSDQGISLHGMASIDGIMYGWSTTDRLYIIDPTDSTLTEVGGQTSNIQSLVVINRTLYGIDASSPYEIWKIDLDTGSLTEVERAGGSLSASFTLDNILYTILGTSLWSHKINSPPFTSIDFAGEDYTTAIAQVVEANNRIQVNVEKLQRNAGDAFISISGSYKK